jgi:hypothetical protein
MKPKTFLKAAGLLIGTYGPRACAGRIIPLERAGGTSNANLPLKHNVDNSDLHGLDIVGNSTVATLAATQARAPISDEEWEALGLEGCRLLKAMASTNAEAAPYVGAADSAESPWKDFGKVQDHRCTQCTNCIQALSKPGAGSNALHSTGATERDLVSTSLWLSTGSVLSRRGIRTMAFQVGSMRQTQCMVQSRIR